jgi:outer membrane receptor protein involved in Fe transport
VGVDYRHEKGLYLPDPVSAAGESTGNNAAPTQGGFNVTEAYGELLIPLLNNLPGVNDLELNLAARTFKYSTFGSDSTYKIGLRYSPVRDVVLRGTYSTAFRAPNIGELYASGVSDSYDFTPNGDPCSNLTAATAAFKDACVANGLPAALRDIGSGDTAQQMLSKRGSNPDLKPETAKIFTVGAVIEPRWVPNLTLTLDYYMIDLTKTVNYQGASVIMAGCFDNGSAADCAKIHRDVDGIIIRIDDRLANQGGTKTAGLDMAARYQLPTASLGQFGFMLDGTLLQQYDVTQSDLTVIKGKGRYDYGVLPAFKANAGINWAMSGLTAGVTSRYIGSYIECESTVCSFDDPTATPTPLHRTVKAYVTADLNLGYSMKSSAGTTSVAVGIQNVGDTQPPWVFTAANYSADPDYNYVGRFYYGRLTQSF